MKEIIKKIKKIIINEMIITNIGILDENIQDHIHQKREKIKKIKIKIIKKRKIFPIFKTFKILALMQTH